MRVTLFVLVLCAFLFGGYALWKSPPSPPPAPLPIVSSLPAVSAGFTTNVFAPESTDRSPIQNLPNRPAAPASASNPIRELVPQSSVEQGVELILNDVLQRNPVALQRLGEISRQIHEKLNRGEDPQQLFTRFHDVFTRIGRLAGAGEDAAFDALIVASADPYLQGVAVMGLGEAAGLGHPRALEMLLHPKENGLLESGTVGALKPAADAGNENAVAAIAEFAFRTNVSGLWYLTAAGLEQAAVRGDARAVQALQEIARHVDNPAGTEAARILRRAGVELPKPPQ